MSPHPHLQARQQFFELYVNISGAAFSSTCPQGDRIRLRFQLSGSFIFRNFNSRPRILHRFDAEGNGDNCPSELYATHVRLKCLPAGWQCCPSCPGRRR